MSSAESEKQGVGLPPLLDPQSPGMINRAGDRHSGLGRQRLRKLPGFREASSLLLPQTPLRWMWESSCGVWSQEWGGCLGKGEGKLASRSWGDAGTLSLRCFLNRS